MDRRRLLSLASLFEQPTIAGVAEMIDLLVLTSRRSEVQIEATEREEFNL